MSGIFDDLVIPSRPFRENRPFGKGDQIGRWPDAQLVIKTRNSTYAFHIEGGDWETAFTLAYTTNETAQQWVGERVILGTHGSVQKLITEVLYGRLSVEFDLPALQQMVGRPYSFQVMDWKGMYGCDRELIAEWRITTVRSVELQIA